MNIPNIAGIKTEFHKKIDIIFLISLSLLILISYGKFWQRGGYADDFPFLAYSSSQGYVSAIMNWYHSISPRLSAAIFTPLFMKAFSAARPENFVWWPFHLAAIMLFISTVILFDKILKYFKISHLARIVAVSVFALFPIKYEILFWPSVIIGHTIPVFILFLASWLYLDPATVENASYLKRFVTVLLFWFAALSLENILPVLIVIACVRLAAFPASRKTVYLDLSWIILTALIIFAVHHCVPVSAKGPVLFKYLLMDTHKILSRIMDISFTSLYRIFTYPLILLHDNYYWDALNRKLMSADFLCAVFPLTLLYLCFIRQLDNAVCRADNKITLCWYPVLIGISIWFAAISPFMLVSYFFPNRAFYIPLAGLAITVAGVVGVVGQSLKPEPLRRMFSGSIVLVLALFVLLNMHIQDRFYEIWKLEQGLIGTLSRLKDGVSPGSAIYVFNLPVFHEPGIRVESTSTFNGMTSWIFADKNIAGHSQANLTDVFSVSSECLSENGTTFTLPKNKIALFYTDGIFIRADSLRLFSSGIHGNEANNGSLSGIVRPISGNMVSNDICILTARDAICFKRLDCIVLRIEIKAQGNISDKRLILHANYKDGRMVSYDKYVKAEAGFRKKGGIYRKDVFIQDLSKLDSISIYLSNKKEMFYNKSRIDDKITINL